mmetsp:Transcript_6958/g.10181  ORF Transcript_6958/g.10181 Transcript_6958/m.10181 type:complete len:219 (-) Transcript_6958:475-1131(-)
MASSLFNSLTCCSYCFSSALSLKCTLIVASFFTRIILDANFRVDSVSSSCAFSPHIFAIIVVTEFPPKESFNIYVSLDCRYGIWSLAGDDKATTTCSKNVSDLLMYFASVNVCPLECVFPTRSDPAKSTKLSFDKIVFPWDSTLDRISKWIVKTQCDREDCLFILCSVIARLVSPSNIKDMACSSFSTTSCVKFRTKICPSDPSIICKSLSFCKFNKS